MARQLGSETPLSQGHIGKKCGYVGVQRLGKNCIVSSFQTSEIILLSHALSFSPNSINDSYNRDPFIRLVVTATTDVASSALRVW